jgi:sugar (pentulose or hexulose) kinase
MYLIVNLGLKSIRGIIFDENGNQIFSSSRAIYSKLTENKVEQDVVEWKSKVKELMLEIESMDSISKEIKFITSTTSSSCIFGMDETGNPLTKVMMVSDKRSAREATEIESFLQKSNSTLSCPASSVIPKALWYKRNNEKVFDKISYWMGAGEFINYFFTEEIFTDSLNASKALFENGNYNNELLNKLDLDSSSLPSVVDIGTTFSVKPSVIDTYNLNESCKYVLTTYDAICAVIGSFDGEKNTACDVSGTVTSVRVLADEGLEDGKGLILSQKLGQYEKYLIGASNNLGGGIIEWHKQSFFQEEDKNVYNIMENYAGQVSSGANGIVFLPYLLGERSPIKVPEASGVFFGINRSSTIKDFTRAVFESTAYVSNHLLQSIIQNYIKIY